MVAAWADPLGTGLALGCVDFLVEPPFQFMTQQKLRGQPILVLLILEDYCRLFLLVPVPTAQIPREEAAPNLFVKKQPNNNLE